MKRIALALGVSTLLLTSGPIEAGADELNGAGAAQAMQQAILAKPGGAEKVLSLQDDPNVKSLLRDDSVMRAVRSGNFGALASDARVQALMRNPTVRGLSKDVQR